jgi:hypothetical protein
MKKKLFFVTTLAASLSVVTPVSAQTDKEITFRDIPWGTNYTDVDNTLGEFNLMKIAGEDYQTKSIDDIIYGDYQGIDFKYNDINIIGSSLNNDVDVAGYTPEQIQVYLAYVPVNGVITHADGDSSLYGAQYEFYPVNIDQMESDLKEKLSNLYGKPDDEKDDKDWLNSSMHYTFWNGANDTELVLKSVRPSEDDTLTENTIYISYIWKKGDELLQAAEDILANDASSNEASVSGNGSTNGL